MVNLVFWLLAVGLTPLVLSITYQLIGQCARTSDLAHVEVSDAPVEADRRARCLRIRFEGGSGLGKGRPVWTRVDGPERKRSRPVRLRLTSR